MNDSMKNLCEFIDASPTPYHAVENLAAFFTARGAQELKEGDVWRLEPGWRTSYAETAPLSSLFDRDSILWAFPAIFWREPIPTAPASSSGREPI